jgi:hypothetical protein
MNPEIQTYNNSINETELCDLLATKINTHLKNFESKIWHSHPVWFIDENPIVGYSEQKNGIRLMFWSGADFDEEKLNVLGKKFKDASIFYNSINDIESNELKRWLKKSENIQWDYKNLIKRKGVLLRLK